LPGGLPSGKTCRASRRHGGWHGGMALIRMSRTHENSPGGTEKAGKRPWKGLEVMEMPAHMMWTGRGLRRQTLGGIGAQRDGGAAISACLRGRKPLWKLRTSFPAARTGIQRGQGSALRPTHCGGLLDQVHEVVDAELAHDPAAMDLDGPLGTLQDVRDALVADALKDQA
jgi:hypothetical protein